METQHTPGPWEAIGNLVRSPMLQDHGSGVMLAECRDRWFLSNNSDEAKANARLMAASPSLLAAQTMGQSLNTPDFLEWCADRFVKVYGERENADYIHSLRERARAGREAVRKAKEAA